MSKYRTAYSRQCFMLPETHGNIVYDHARYLVDRQLVIKPTLRFDNYDDLNFRGTNACWAVAVGTIFGEPVEPNTIQYLPLFQGSSENVKFYYQKQSCQVWRFTRLP